MRTITRSDEILHSLVHDLRQPLGNLETSLFFLEMVLDHPSDRVREQMHIMARRWRRLRNCWSAPAKSCASHRIIGKQQLPTVYPSRIPPLPP